MCRVWFPGCGSRGGGRRSCGALLKPSRRRRFRIMSARSTGSNMAPNVPPEALDALVRSSAKVATQPSFRLPEWRPVLVHCGQGGCCLIFIASAPLWSEELTSPSPPTRLSGDPDPMRGIFSAVERKTASGSVLAANECIEVLEALESYTAASARASGIASQVGGDNARHVRGHDPVRGRHHIGRGPERLIELRPCYDNTGRAGRVGVLNPDSSIPTSLD